MKNEKLAAKKLLEAMNGLKAAYPRASTEEKAEIRASLREIRPFYDHLVLAADDAEEDDGAEEAEDLPMDSVSEEDAPKASDDADAESMDDAHMEDSDMLDSESTASDTGIQIPPEFLGDLKDLGLIDDAGDMDDGAEDMDLGEVDDAEGDDDMSEGMDMLADDMGAEDADDMEAGAEEAAESDEDSEEDSESSDEELATAALELAASALKVFAADDGEKDEDNEEEDAEPADDVLDEDELLALEGEGILASAKKLREISARLAKVQATKKVVADHDEEEHEDTQECPACEGTGEGMGSLGSRKHYRCRDCGIDFSKSGSEASASTKRGMREVLGGSKAKASTRPMTSEEEKAERDLRNARRDLFSDDPEIASKAEAEIERCKKVLAPYWNERAEEQKHQAGQRLLYRMASAQDEDASSDEDNLNLEDDIEEFNEFESPEVIAFSQYAEIMASLDANERRELLKPETISAKRMDKAALAKMAKNEKKNRAARKARSPVMKSKTGKPGVVRLPGGKSKKIKKKYFFNVYGTNGKNLGQHWMSTKTPSKETLEAYNEQTGAKHPYQLPQRRLNKRK